MKRKACFSVERFIEKPDLETAKKISTRWAAFMEWWYVFVEMLQNPGRAASLSARADSEIRETTESL